ncbi:MAG: 4-oxalocrotonate tautomerase family protein [Aestuariibacter sp.]
MPYVNIQITKEGGPGGSGASAEQKKRLISGVTMLLKEVLGKSPNTTHVVIQDIELDNWGVGGLPVPEFRNQN